MKPEEQLKPAPLERVRNELRLGMETAADTQNASVIAAGGAATTTLESPWVGLHCPVCRHSFRLGDPVWIEPSLRRVCHSSALLPCAGQAAAATESPELAAFFAGLDEAWPPPADVPVRRLEPNDTLVASPSAGFRRHRCAVCGHTLRPFDRVVLCPCQPTTPRCRIAVHRDPAHGLNCWTDWNPGAHLHYCLATLNKLSDAAPD